MSDQDQGQDQDPQQEATTPGFTTSQPQAIPDDAYADAPQSYTPPSRPDTTDFTTGDSVADPRPPAKPSQGIMDFVTGKGAADPRQLTSLVDAAKRAGAANDSEAVVHAIGTAPPEQQGPLIQTARNLSGTGLAHAAAASNAGDLDRSGKFATAAMGYIPDGNDVKFQAGKDGMTATVTGLGDTGKTQSFKMNPQNWHSYITGPDVKFDSVMDGDVQKGLAKAGGEGGTQEGGSAATAGSQTGEAAGPPNPKEGDNADVPYDPKSGIFGHTSQPEGSPGTGAPADGIYTGPDGSTHKLSKGDTVDQYNVVRANPASLKYGQGDESEEAPAVAVVRGGVTSYEGGKKTPDQEESNRQLRNAPKANYDPGHATYHNVGKTAVRDWEPGKTTYFNPAQDPGPQQDKGAIAAANNQSREKISAGNNQSREGIADRQIQGRQDVANTVAGTARQKIQQMLQGETDKTRAENLRTAVTNLGNAEKSGNTDVGSSIKAMRAAGLGDDVIGPLTRSTPQRQQQAPQEDPNAQQAPAPKQNEVLPLPSDKTQMVAGKVYMTKNGPLPWSGTGFPLPRQ
jgi:hypothetical protein